MAFAAVLVGCSDKEEDSGYKFGNYQWLSEEIPSELGIDLKGELLIDADVNEQGGISFAIIAQKNSNMGIEEGDIILLQSATYNISKKDDSGKRYSLLVNEQFYSIEFINETKPENVDENPQPTEKRVVNKRSAKAKRLLMLSIVLLSIVSVLLLVLFIMDIYYLIS